MVKPKNTPQSAEYKKATQGRPLKYRSAMELERVIENYFQQQDSKEKPYTITGMALFLGMTRKNLIEYGERENFVNVINRARARIESQVEDMLLTGKNQAGCIFWLKNQGWSDKQEIEVNDITQLPKDELVRKLQAKIKQLPTTKQAKVVNE